MDLVACIIWARWRRWRSARGRWSRAESLAPKLADSGVFAASAAVVMWAWFYLPERLPKSYGKWIGEVAKVDSRLIEALRRARRGVFVYGKDTGQAPLLESMCKDYGWPIEWGDPSKTIPIPCEMVHMSCGPNCEKHAVSRYYTASLILGTVALAYGSVPLYKMICQQTGWGGQPILTHRGGDADTASRVTPVTDARRLRITFNGSVSDVLPWKFTPQQREVRVLPGETALAFYTATNKGPSDIIGVATYSVTPGQVAPYFSKIQCFCFEEQKLNAGESVDMPVFFYIDPDFTKDPQMKGIDTITLSYTFFKARYDDNGVLKPIPTN
ncbi:Cytochrome c oxidase assembly protein ctaG [Aspergillus oryzae]|uniref:Cytochrome c oxidase assembly protein ctaG n=1 Tax=Aspergillus oryzae TaxID=5062 RepID=A0A1S9E0U0_ASPOZ|nr:Cytochrome c oxidase assembly protein ctaG [Aspergillus oryzae]